MTERARRLVLLALAGVFAAAAVAVARRPGLPQPQWWQRWQQAHPDPRGLTAAEHELFSGLREGERRQDLLLLLAALSAGCAAAGASPRLVAHAGGAAAAVLVAGSVATGTWGLGQSIAGQWQGAREGSWTVGDDNLDIVAGVHAQTLRAWRQQVGPADAVILAGTDQPLLNVVAWALHPRPLYPLLIDVPSDASVETLRAAALAVEVGRGHAARWLVDLAALRAGAAARHPALLRVDA